MLFDETFLMCITNQSGRLVCASITASIGDAASALPPANAIQIKRKVYFMSRHRTSNPALYPFFIRPLEESQRKHKKPSTKRASTVLPPQQRFPTCFYSGVSNRRKCSHILPSQSRLPHPRDRSTVSPKADRGLFDVKTSAA